MNEDSKQIMREIGCRFSNMNPKGKTNKDIVFNQICIAGMLLKLAELIDKQAKTPNLEGKTEENLPVGTYLI